MLPEGVKYPQEHTWPVQLRAGGLVLRPLRRRDRRAWSALRNRNRAWLREWDATSPPDSPGPLTFNQMVRLNNRAAVSWDALPLAICWDEAWPRSSWRARESLIGQINVSGIMWGAARMGQVGYWIDEGHAGRGLVPTAVALVTDYCFGVLGLHRLEINIRPENEPSLRVVRKLGYRPEGLRKQYLHINGEWRDHLSFALTTEEISGGLLARYLAETGASSSSSE